MPWSGSEAKASGRNDFTRTSPIRARQARSVGASTCRTPRLRETDDEAKSEVEESRDSSPGLLSIRPGHPEPTSRSSRFSSLGGHLPRVSTSLPDSSCLGLRLFRSVLNNLMSGPSVLRPSVLLFLRPLCGFVFSLFLLLVPLVPNRALAFLILFSKLSRALGIHPLDSIPEVNHVEVDEQPHGEAAQLEVRDQLRLVDRSEFLDGFEFQNNGVLDLDVKA